MKNADYQKRNILILLSLALVVIGLIFMQNDRDGFPGMSFSIKYENGEAAINIWQDERKDAFYLFLPSFSDIDEVQINVLGPNTVRIGGCEYEDGDYLKGYRTNREYSITVLGANNDVIQTGNIIFMQSKHIPGMFIHTKSGDTDYLHADKGNRESGTMLMINEDGSVAYDDRLNFIKGRGNLSWAGEKKPYNIQLSEEKNLLGMGEAQEWALLANHSDMSSVRNKIVYEFAKKTGFSFSPDSEFVDLYINGAYAGIYQLSERIEIGKSRLDIYGLEEETRRMNPRDPGQYGFVETGSSRAYRIPGNPENIFEGYLLQLELSGFYKDDPSWLVTGRNQPLAVVSPEYASLEQIEYVEGFLNGFEEALYSGTGVNSFGKKYTDYMDMDSWAMKYLLEEVFANQDAEWSSQFFYIAGKDGEYKLFAGPPWDYDSALGNHSEDNVMGLNPRAFIALWRGQHDPKYLSWYSELNQKSDFRSAVTALYEQRLKPYLDELLAGGMKGYFEQIHASALMNRIRWHGDTDIRSARTAINDANVYLLKYMSERIGFLDSVWIDDERYYTLAFNGLRDNIYYSYSVRDGQTVEEAPVPEPDGYILEGWYYLDTGTPFDKTRPVTEDTVLNAKWRISLLSLFKRYYLLVPVIGAILVFIIVFVKRKCMGLRADAKKHG